MKKYLLATVILCFSMIMVQAQVKTPAPSPLCKVEQSVGMTDISIEYSRPSVKDRTIFGDFSRKMARLCDGFHQLHKPKSFTCTEVEKHCVSPASKK